MIEYVYMDIEQGNETSKIFIEPWCDIKIFIVQFNDVFYRDEEEELSAYKLPKSDYHKN